MPYLLEKADADKISVALVKYYENAFADGVRGVMDKLARKNMGIYHQVADIANDTYASLTKKSNDSFGVMFESELKLKIGIYFANRSDVMHDAVTVAKFALGKLAEAIPIPVLATIVSKIIDLAASEAESELHQRGTAETDRALDAQSSPNFYTEDTEIAKLAALTMEKYKLFGSYISSVPTASKSFDDIVTLPGAVFKMQATASTIAISVAQIRQYLTAMEDRLLVVSKKVEEYKGQLAIKLPESVKSVLIDVYNKNLDRGKREVTANKYTLISTPVLSQPEHEGGATLLAAHIAYASAVGYYDARSNFSGNNPPIVKPSSQVLASRLGGRH